MAFSQFSGFFLNPESTPVFLKWVEWLSPMKYAFSALARLEFAGLELDCARDQMRVVLKEGTSDVQEQSAAALWSLSVDNAPNKVHMI